MKAEIRNFIIFIVLGALLIVAVYFLLPYLKEQEDLNTSDAGSLKGTIKIGVDNWIGYFPLCGKETKKRLRSYGYALKCIDDNANYAQRFSSLKRGEIDFAVGTVDSYLVNGDRLDYPGSIVLVIDESRGGDAIVARKDAVASLEALKNKNDVRIAFTPDSPSAHLLKSVSVHFDIPALAKADAPGVQTTNGSEEALKVLLSNAVDVAVLWEPDVSKALKNKEIIKLLGTENTSRLIVDILVASRDVLGREPEKAQVLLTSYFRALKKYSDNPELLRDEIKAAHSLKDSEIRTMLEGVEWKNLTDNALDWFGISQGSELGYEGLIDSIESVLDIGEQVGDFSGNPLPEGDPYRLLNRQYIEDLYSKYSIGQFGMAKDERAQQLTFEPLTPSQWRSLKEIGTLKIRPITFQSGTATLDTRGKEELDKLASNLEHYPNFRVLVKGHSGTTGDPQQNRVLSQERADSTARYLHITHDIDENRVHTIGLGQDEPLMRKPGEALRTYRYRLPRVELKLLGDSF